jgi:hypothetical protein
MTTQPEALRLADELIRTWCLPMHAAELRRLHAVNEELLEALKSLIDMDVAYRRGPKVEEAVEAARVAIAKATGETK